jgi:cytosine/adenosine deaminase-related metal-dependent hydrolase
MAEDMVEAVRTALFMERVRTGDAMDPQPEDVLQWATRNGARALGLDDVGTLEPGRKADLVVLDTRRAHLVPTMRIVSAFVHNGQPADIESVMVDGTWITVLGGGWEERAVRRVTTVGGEARPPPSQICQS